MTNWLTFHYTEESQEQIARIVRKRYGPQAFFQVGHKGHIHVYLPADPGPGSYREGSFDDLDDLKRGKQP